jgi:hypothetical protein
VRKICTQHRVLKFQAKLEKVVIIGKTLFPVPWIYHLIPRTNTKHNSIFTALDLLVYELKQ